MKNMRKSLVQAIVFLRKIQRSLSSNFSSRTPWRILSGKARSREFRQKPGLGRNCRRIISCASLPKGPICITHRHRREGSVLSRLLTLIRSHSSQQRSSVSDSALKCNAICNDQARHFNLLLPQVSFSSALLYYKATKNPRSRLSTHSKNWNGLVELFFCDL